MIDTLQGNDRKHNTNRIHTSHGKSRNLENLEMWSMFWKVMEKVLENENIWKKSWKRSWKIFLVLKKILFTVLQSYLEITFLLFHNCTGSNLAWWRFWSLLLICLEKSTAQQSSESLMYFLVAMVMEKNMEFRH